MKMSPLNLGPPGRPLHPNTSMSTGEPDASNLLIVAKLRRSLDASRASAAAAGAAQRAAGRRCYTWSFRNGVGMRHQLIIQAPGGPSVGTRQCWERLIPGAESVFRASSAAPARRDMVAQSLPNRRTGAVNTYMTTTRARYCNHSPPRTTSGPEAATMGRDCLVEAGKGSRNASERPGEGFLPPGGIGLSRTAAGQNRIQLRSMIN